MNPFLYYGDKRYQWNDGVRPPHVENAHWGERSSTKRCFKAWSHCQSLPQSIRDCLEGAPEWRGFELARADLEARVDIDAHRNITRDDVASLFTRGHRRGIVIVEAKNEDEDFGVPSGHSTYPGYKLDTFAETIGLSTGALVRIKGQLLARTSSAIVRAKKSSASHAAVVVQCFGSNAPRRREMNALLEVFGVGELSSSGMSAPVALNGVNLRFGWAQTPIP